MIRFLFDKLESKLIYKPHLNKWSDELRGSHQEFEIIDFGENKIKLRFCDLGTKDIIIFSHGNATNLSKLDKKYNFFEKIGLSYLVYDYPGYGQSTGKPSEQSLYASHEAVVNFVSKELKFKSENTILYGQSLGGGVACEYASKNSVKAVILEATFTCTYDMGKLILKGLPFQYIVSNKFNNIEKINLIKAPLFISHGTEDEVIPFSFGKKLFEKSTSKNLYFYEIKDCDHYCHIEKGGEDYLEAIKTFVNNVE